MQKFSQPLADMQRFRRTMLLVIIAMGLLGTVVGWYVMRLRGVDSPTLVAIQAVSALVLAVLGLAAWLEWLPRRIVEFGCFGFAVAVCAACMLLRLYWPRLGAAIELAPLYLWFPILYVFAFVLGDHRAGLWVALAVMALFVAISLPYLLLDTRDPVANITVQMHVVSAAIIATLYFFSGYQHRLRQAQARADHLAVLSNTDELTGLINRRGMGALLDDALQRGTDRTTFAMLLFDIDHFKAINDVFGHRVGDATLVTLAMRATQVLRGAGVVSRWGGDEFVALVRGMGAAEVITLAGVLRQVVADHPFGHGQAVTISCGVTVGRHGDSIDSLFQRADAALYAAKRGGRNGVEGAFESR